MDPDGFERLGQHLMAVDDFMRATAADFGYVRQMSGVGKYPRRRFVRVDGRVRRWVDLWMELDSTGSRFEVFDPSIPYELAGGAFIDDGDTLVRRGIRFRVFQGVPFDRLTERLRLELCGTFERVTLIRESEIFETGEQSKLAGRP